MDDKVINVYHTNFQKELDCSFFYAFQSWICWNLVWLFTRKSYFLSVDQIFTHNTAAMHKRMLEFVKSSKKSDSKKRNKHKNRNASSKQGQNSCLNSDEDTTAKSETKVSEVNEANEETSLLSSSSSALKAMSASTASFDIRGKEYYLSQIQVLENAIREMKHKTKQPTYFKTGSCWIQLQI